MVRAVRLAATLGFDDRAGDPRAIRERAPLAAHLSGERIAAELGKLLAADRPSVGLRLMRGHGPARGRPAGARGPARASPRTRSRARTCWTTRCARSTRPRRPTRSSGWRRCSTTSASRRRSPTAGSAATRRSAPRWPGAPRPAARAAGRRSSGWSHLVRHHMFTYEPAWTDAGRPAVHRQGRAASAIDDLFALREADNVGSGVPATRDGLAELRARVDAELAAAVRPRSVAPGGRRRRPDRRARAPPGPRSAGSSTSCSSG